MNEPKPPFSLTEEERRSPLWQKLVAHFSEELGKARESNDHDGPDFITYRTRGRIEQLKRIIALNEAPRVIDSEF